MGQRFRFAIISDPHIARPETIYTGPHRFHLVEVSIPGIEQIFDQLETLDLDFLLLPGDHHPSSQRSSSHAWRARQRGAPPPQQVEVAREG